MPSTSKIPFVFFGTPHFAVFVLEELDAAGFKPSLIVTAPDKPQGRKLVITPPPVKRWAIERNISILQPEKLDSSFLYKLRTTDYGLFTVAAYGKILPKALLDIPKHGVLNVHPSLLPRLRGASPVRSAILEDERATGVSIMLMDEKMDHGPIVAQATIELEPSEWPPKARIFEELMAREGGKLLAEVMPEWIAGNITPEPQDDSKATFCKKITKEDGLIDLSGDPYKNFLKIRGYDGWPGAYFFAERSNKKIRVKINDAEFSNGRLTLKRVTPEGKKEMGYEAFLRS
ncbi:methionyl-tRNA formyltransferase [Candidatus Kaiserbacteria bacterium RIFCSPHIGHO2_01_FULL_49_13]|uniref:Methionyl-tRNA formyltransferase n=1 Tax=Candidatus Kaiserbacteria bacterium RIFCSPHIGHO2_01_FULL_49_13 TaxID=1798477 RepID=A0A1F6CDL0_9BACT|nr:MAG: methionyl-tRNA formyltransferase [Candidatus Kaiserbacteria bacterium RIFCSPHIGHO2_01_FULL_49_13]